MSASPITAVVRIPSASTGVVTPASTGNQPPRPPGAVLLVLQLGWSRARTAVLRSAPVTTPANRIAKSSSPRICPLVHLNLVVQTRRLHAADSERRIAR